jgi:hypothetical protein
MKESNSFSVYSNILLVFHVEQVTRLVLPVLMTRSKSVAKILRYVEPIVGCLSTPF